MSPARIYIHDDHANDDYVDDDARHVLSLYAPSAVAGCWRSLGSGAPAGVCCVGSPTKSFRKLKTPGSTQVVPHFLKKLRFWAPIWLKLAHLARLVLHVRPSCPTWFLLASNLAHLCSNLAQLSANLAQLGPILAQLGSNLVQFWSQLGPTWSQNLTKMSFKRCFLATPSDVQFCTDF